MSSHQPLKIRQARPADTGLLVRFIQELAVVEDFPYPVTVTEADLSESLFGQSPAAEALIGFSGKRPVCFAVFYYSFSTTTGRRGLHLDDLFVRPQYQGAGYGKTMLKHLAAIAKSKGCARFEWWTLRSNEQALGFFQSVGARRLEELVIHRTQGAELSKLASDDS